MSASTDEELERPVEDNEFEGARDRFPRYAFGAFHREELPSRVEQYGHLVVDDLRDVPPLAFRAGDETFTYVPSSRGIDLQEEAPVEPAVVHPEPT